MQNARCTIKTGIVIALFVFLVNCSLGTRTTSLRGRVHSGDQIIGGGDVRLSSKDKEATATVGNDGYFRIELEHPKGARLELKILQPGFEHDKIEFNSLDAPQGEMDIKLRRIFKPGINTSTNSSANQSVNK
jgi:hypothetical protein